MFKTHQPFRSNPKSCEYLFRKAFLIQTNANRPLAEKSNSTFLFFSEALHTTRPAKDNLESTKENQDKGQVQLSIQFLLKIFGSFGKLLTEQDLRLTKTPFLTNLQFKGFSKKLIECVKCDKRRLFERLKGPNCSYLKVNNKACFKPDS